MKYHRDAHVKPLQAENEAGVVMTGVIRYR
jgi:hypothetical protein